MTVEEIKKLKSLEFTIENTLKGGRIYISVNREFAELFRKALNELEESEEKSMLHNAAVKCEKNKVLEQYWVMQAIQKDFQTDFMITCAGIFAGKGDRLLNSKELDHEPTPEEIAQFLYDSKADFVSVVQNYRFENELPFC